MVDADGSCFSGGLSVQVGWLDHGLAATFNKWSKNSDERPHRHLVTPHVGEWIHPISTLSWIRPSQPPNGISMGSAVFAYTAANTSQCFSMGRRGGQPPKLPLPLVI